MFCYIHQKWSDGCNSQSKSSLREQWWYFCAEWKRGNSPVPNLHSYGLVAGELMNLIALPFSWKWSSCTLLKTLEQTLRVYDFGINLYVLLKKYTKWQMTGHESQKIPYSFQFLHLRRIPDGFRFRMEYCCEQYCIIKGGCLTSGFWWYLLTLQLTYSGLLIIKKKHSPTLYLVCVNLVILGHCGSLLKVATSHL